MKKYMRILKIDLTKKKTTVEKRDDLNQYLGGVALATQLLKQEVAVDQPALEAIQPIIFAKGPLNTIFPVVTKVCSMFKSPLTGELGESYGGLRMAMAMGMANLDAIVIVGQSKEPVYIHIDGDEVKIKDAKPLWNLNIDEATRLLHDQEGHRGLRSILTIGEGGVNKVKFASVTIDSYRHFGRLGLGCVMGSKNLKAMVIEGETNKPMEHLKDYKKVYSEIYEKVTETDMMEKYHGLGTSININLLNDLKSLPIHNFKRNSCDEARNISGESFAENRLIKKIACSGCPIGCIHIALLRKQFGESYEYEATTLSYDHELIYSLGAMVGIWDLDGVLQLIEVVELLGLDAISTGVLLAWVTEAFEKNIVTIKDTIETPEFGNVDTYKKIIQYIVKKPNAFYEALAEGTDYATQKYGGEDFAMVLGKNEVAGYHTGYGNILGQAVGARHSHLDNAGYSIDQENEENSDEALVKKLMEEEISRNMLNSLVICLFARKIYDDATVVKALNSIGYEVNEDTLKKLGLDTFLEKMRLKEDMGFKLQNLTFPNRFFETESCDRRLSSEKTEDLLKLYIKEAEKLLSYT
ncbi:MAG: aldehyde:ferredoxin oxidoreductase [Clostridiaceae bacterium]|nr:aldehyde:ferredoxin oxidoreductase [Clostridiaceae bacterium]